VWEWQLLVGDEVGTNTGEDDGDFVGALVVGADERVAVTGGTVGAEDRVGVLVGRGAAVLGVVVGDRVGAVGMAVGWGESTEVGACDGASTQHSFD
jgi:hypothetical protein